MSGEQAIFNLEIKKKSGLSLNPDIHHSKVFSSGKVDTFYLKNAPIYSEKSANSNRVFATNSNFLISLSLQLHGVNL